MIVFLETSLSCYDLLFDTGNIIIALADDTLAAPVFDGIYQFGVVATRQTNLGKTVATSGDANLYCQAGAFSVPRPQIKPSR